jgi:hypothetical protein
MTLLIGFMAVSVHAQQGDFKPVADEFYNSGGISWTPKINYSKLVLTISRPDGTTFRKTIESGVTPYIGLSEIMGESNMDGSYTYELRVIPMKQKLSRDDKNTISGVRSERIISKKATTQTGYILVKQGAIVTRNIQEPANNNAGGISISNGSLSTQNRISGTQDQVTQDDVIVIGSLCVGQDCQNGENFSFDTIRLRENNLRIRFYDTSNSSSFPTRDWQITANDSNNGGADKFSIDDIDAGRTPFTLIAGAPNNSIYVDQQGDVGFGTSNPVADLHVVNGNTPTLRLEQDSSSGFTAQTWDLAGNEANFFIRDATNGGTLPVRVRPGAPSSAIDVQSDGDVGIGTSSPSYSLHVSKSGTKASIAATRADSGITVEMSATPAAALIGTVSDHPMRFRVKENLIMEIFGETATNQIEMFGGGNYSAGKWNDASSRELKEQIKTLSTSEAVEALEELQPVKFHYKKNKNEEHVGFIAEDVPELVANANRKSLSSMDIVAVLTTVVKEQQKSLKEQQKAISQLKKKIVELEKKQK